MNKILLTAITTLIISLFLPAGLSAGERSDSVSTSAMPPLVAEVMEQDNEEPEHNWWKLLKQGKLNLADTTVEYPKFMGFCVKVYNWADKTFNSYDTTYVVGTGRRWKARVVSDNWVDSYYLNIEKKMPIRMMSDIYCNAGAYVQYMAVSVGYSLDMSNVIGNKPSNHKKLEFNFNCARFNIEGH